jgi:methyl-accepting chemotaxis protein
VFQKITIGKQLLLVFSAVLALLCFIGIISCWSFYKLYTKIETLQSNAKISDAAMQVRIDYANLRRFEKGIFINIDSIEKQEPYFLMWKKVDDNVKNTIFELKKSSLFKEDQEKALLMQKTLTNYESGVYETIERLRKEEFKDAQQANQAMDKYRWAANELETLGKTLATETHQRSTLSLQNLDQQLNHIVLTIFAALLIAFIISLTLGLLFTHSIRKPLLQVVNIAERVALGDIYQDIVIGKQPDEIARLLLSIRKMIESLKENAVIVENVALGNLAINVKENSDVDTFRISLKKMVSDLQNAAISIKNTADQISFESSQIEQASEYSSKVNKNISDSVHTTSAALQQINANTQNIARKTQEQLSLSNEVSTSGLEFLSSMDNITKTSKEMLIVSEQLEKDVINGVKVVEKNTEGIIKINNNLCNLEQTINVLHQRTKNVSMIVQVIANLADQTNLLALNAAIEAARAGEHGLGFTVVADEVRRLSDRCAHSTKEIAELITNIEKDMIKAVDCMQQSTKTANESASLCNSTNTALKRIKKSATEVNQFIFAVNKANNEQNGVWTSIVNTFTSVNYLTQEINAATVEQNIGVQEITREVERIVQVINQNSTLSSNLANNSKEMAIQSQNLQKIVRYFHLEITS